jgi:hypothetical protein
VTKGDAVSEGEQVKPKAKMGRPSKKTPKTVEELLLRISMGRSVANVSQDEDMPDLRTIFRWVASDEEFRHAYARACANRSLVYADTIGDIAKGVMAGKIPPDAGRVAIDSYKWIAARLMPKYYGEKQQIEATVNHTHTLHLSALKQLADEARAARGDNAKVIDAVTVPQLQHQQPLDAVQQGFSVAGIAQDPHGCLDGGGALVRGPSHPHVQQFDIENTETSETPEDSEALNPPHTPGIKGDTDAPK